MPRRKAVPALGSLCLQSLVQHMQSVWVKDYSENYLDEYSFRFVMGPFNDLGEPWGWRRRRRRRKAGRQAVLFADPHCPQPAVWCRTSSGCWARAAACRVLRCICCCCPTCRS